LLWAIMTTAPAPLAVCCYHMGANGYGQPGRVHSRALHRRHHHPYIAIDIDTVAKIARMRLTGLRRLPARFAAESEAARIGGEAGGWAGLPRGQADAMSRRRRWSLPCLACNDLHAT
jgi:hypothetical protein